VIHQPGEGQRFRAAWAAALYGRGGFYRRERPAAHFRTSVHASPLFAAAVTRLAAEVDEALGCPDPFDLVDVGCGGGELLAAVETSAPRRWRLTGVEVDDDVPRWTGLLVANEWLDDVPCEVVELADDGVRYVLADGGLGEPVGKDDGAWLDAWWPLTEVGDRAEVGRARDEAWRAAVGNGSRGVAVAIDYAHTRGDRPPYGTLAGYRAGRAVEPVPDGSCDITAHVALDGCAAVAAGPTLLLSQRDALRRLGVSGRLPAYRGDPAGYLAAVGAATEAGELLDPAGLGGFSWLVCATGCRLPHSLTSAS
jgi:SAM-dependent MidA family methyltransferase